MNHFIYIHELYKFGLFSFQTCHVYLLYIAIKFINTISWNEDTLYVKVDEVKKKILRDQEKDINRSLIFLKRPRKKIRDQEKTIETKKRHKRPMILFMRQRKKNEEVKKKIERSRKKHFLF